METCTRITVHPKAVRSILRPSVRTHVFLSISSRKCYRHIFGNPDSCTAHIPPLKLPRWFTCVRRVEGQGVATISEVSFQTKHVTAGINTLESPTTGGSEGSQQERARIEAELKQVEERITTLNGEIGRLKTQQNVLEGFGGQLVEFADNVSFRYRGF